MRLIPEVLAALGAALVLVVLLLRFRARAVRNQRVQRPVSRGPSNLRFVCASCEEQFTHTKRTLGAWEKGTRRFFCNACHTKWRGSRPPQAGQGSGPASSSAHPAVGRRTGPSSAVGSTSTSRTSFQPARAGSGSGCLGVAMLLIAVPLAVVFVVVQYA